MDYCALLLFFLTALEFCGFNSSYFCYNGGSCVNGLCVCQSPYSGFDCTSYNGSEWWSNASRCYVQWRVPWMWFIFHFMLAGTLSPPTGEMWRCVCAGLIHIASCTVVKSNVSSCTKWWFKHFYCINLVVKFSLINMCFSVMHSLVHVLCLNVVLFVSRLHFTPNLNSIR